MKKFKQFFKRHPMWPVLIPAALMLYFVYISLGWNAWVSVSNWNGSLDPDYSYAGLSNYIWMFQEQGAYGSLFLQTLKNTGILFALIPICLLLGLGMALLMDQGLKGSTAFRSLVMLPFALSFVVTGTMWSWMYDPKKGAINEILKFFGVVIKRGDVWAQWLGTDTMIMPAIIIALVWQFSGYIAVIFLAGIKSVPENVINAAKLDGSYSLRIYWKLIIPQLKGALGSCITILAMYALRSFDLINVMSSVSREGSMTLPVWMYKEMFNGNNFAHSAAISCFLLALVLVLILPLNYLTNKRK